MEIHYTSRKPLANPPLSPTPAAKAARATVALQLPGRPGRPAPGPNLLDDADDADEAIQARPLASRSQILLEEANEEQLLGRLFEITNQKPTTKAPLSQDAAAAANESSDAPDLRSAPASCQTALHVLERVFEAPDDQSHAGEIIKSILSHLGALAVQKEGMDLQEDDKINTLQYIFRDLSEMFGEGQHYILSAAMEHVAKIIKEMVAAVSNTSRLLTPATQEAITKQLGPPPFNNKEIQDMLCASAAFAQMVIDQCLASILSKSEIDRRSIAKTLVVVFEEVGKLPLSNYSTWAGARTFHSALQALTPETVAGVILEVSRTSPQQLPVVLPALSNKHLLEAADYDQRNIVTPALNYLASVFPDQSFGIFNKLLQAVLIQGQVAVRRSATASSHQQFDLPRGLTAKTPKTPAASSSKSANPKSSTAAKPSKRAGLRSQRLGHESGGSTSPVRTTRGSGPQSVPTASGSSATLNATKKRKPDDQHGSDDDYYGPDEDGAEDEDYGSLSKKGKSKGKAKARARPKRNRQ